MTADDTWSEIRRRAQRNADELLVDQLRARADRLARDVLRDLVAEAPGDAAPGDGASGGSWFRAAA
jgi:hypothetical protein